MPKRQEILEYNYKQAIRKQRSITSLFPTFGERVKDVMRKGGPKLVGVTGTGWYFEVSSGTEEGKKYTVSVEFKNVEETLRNILRTTREIYNKDNTVNYKKLADVFIDDVDIQWGCTCPADLFYGGQYIRTQRDANIPPPENRVPRKRNKKEYGVGCKHLETVLEKFPYYITTMGKWLLANYNDYINVEVEKLGKERSFFKAGGQLLAGLEKAQQNA